MKKRIFVLFDVPDDQNDKQWLIDGLSDMYPGKVCSVSINYVLSQLIMIRGGISRIYAYLIIIRQCIRTIIKSGKGDIILCWFSTTGKIMNLISRLLGNNRHIISMNWLNPGGKKHGFHYQLARYAITNPMCTIVVNTSTSLPKWNQFMDYERNDYIVVPDVYDDTVPFEKCNRLFNNTFFSGGYGNRDWSLFVTLAKQNPDCKFICVARKEDFISKVDMNEIPYNLDYYFNTSEKEYYSLMRESSVVVLPIIGNTISGLVNIIRAAQYGLLCCVSRTDSTYQYYSSINKNLVVENNIYDWQQTIERLKSMSNQDFLNCEIDFQKHIKDNFSPSHAVSIISERINKF